MGIFTEYLDQQLNFQQLEAERKKQLARIAELRNGRDVLVYAADQSQNRGALAAISYVDLLPVQDQLANLKGSKLDLLLETPGGSGEVAEDIVCAIRQRYDDVSVIVPGWAKSAGTIIAMSADEILMEATSALGPIDAQLTWQGKAFSAGALLEGVRKIKDEVASTGVLNKAYIPILQGISPGELETAANTQDFAKKLVTSWLVRYKFKNWQQHSTTGKPVTSDERIARAEQIANELRDHSKWLTHARSIRLRDLQEMRLLITDYSKQPDLADAIRRYHTLLHMTLDTGPYKVYETAVSQIYKFLAPASPQGPVLLGQLASVHVDLKCGKCGVTSRLQADFVPNQPLKEGYKPFPRGNRFKCPTCGAQVDLTEARRKIEMQAKKPILQ